MGISFMDDRLLFIDTETGGMDPAKHSLLSMGLLVWKNMEIIDSMEVLINDGILSVTAEALAVNSIDIAQHKKSALSPSLAIEKIFSFIHRHFPQQQKITLAGHNVQFDVNFLKTFFAKNNQDFSQFFSHRIVDTSSILYYLYLSGQIGQKAVSSDDAFDLFNIKVEGRHTALGDVVATAKLFNKLLELTKN